MSSYNSDYCNIFDFCICLQLYWCGSKGVLETGFSFYSSASYWGSFLLMCFCRGNRSYCAAAEKSCVPRDAAHQLNVFRHSSDLAGIDLAQLHVLRAPC